jgi:hypothetical protein
LDVAHRLSVGYDTGGGGSGIELVTIGVLFHAASGLGLASA